MKQFVAWARVSSKSQEREGWSLDEQRDRLEQMALQRGGVIVKLFQIAETASKPAQRKAFGDLVEYAKKNARKLSGILFVKVDRASRNPGDWNTLETLEREHGVNLIFPDQPSGDTPAGRFQRRMAVNMAAFQVEQQAVDIRAGQRRRAVEEGLPNGSAAYGYRFVRINGKSGLEVDPVNGPKVQTIFRLYAQEPLTLDTLVTRLASEGIVYTDATRLFPRSVLHRILNNHTYLARVHYQGQWYPGKFPQLVDAATWQRVQDRLGGRVYHAHEMVYAGSFAKCAHCGHVVTGEQKLKKSPVNGRTKLYVYYRCAKYNRPGHPQERWTEAQIDEQTFALLRQMRVDALTADWLREVISARAHATHSVNANRQKELNRQHANIEVRLSRLMDMRLSNEITVDEHVAKRQSLLDQQSAILAQLEGLHRSNAETADRAIAAFELSQSVANTWLNADYHAKKTILSIIVCEARLNSEGLQVSLRKPFDLLAEGEIQKSNGAMGI